MAQQTQTAKKQASPEVVQKLSDGYRYVTIPATDMYDQPFDGISINGGHGKDGKDPEGKPVLGFELNLQPGKHLLAPDIADEVERILKVWNDSMIRLLRPTPHRASQQQATRRGAEIVANPEAME